MTMLIHLHTTIPSHYFFPDYITTRHIKLLFGSMLCAIIYTKTCFELKEHGYVEHGAKKHEVCVQKNTELLVVVSLFTP